MFEVKVLSLKKDIERREWMESIKPKLGFDFTFFDAFTPQTITADFKQYFKHADFYEWDIDQDAVIATFLSHIVLLTMAAAEQKNLLIIEDDIDILNKLDWNSIDFSEFDIYNLSGQDVACYAYFVTPEGASKILDMINDESYTITQAYDWELFKIKSSLRYKTVESPVFIQLDNKFKSNIAPNGYKKL